MSAKQTAFIVSIIAVATSAAAMAATVDPPPAETRAAAQDLIVTLAMERLCTGQRRILAPTPTDGPSLEERLAEQFMHRHGVAWDAVLGPPGVTITVEATVRISQPLVSDLEPKARNRVCIDNRMRLLKALEGKPLP